MSKTLDEWIAEITAWQDETFPQATPLSAATHLAKEVRELIFDLGSGNPKTAAHEIVDCFFLTIGVAHLSGIDLETALEEKMAINKARTWGKPDADGVVEHIRQAGDNVLITPEQSEMLDEILSENAPNFSEYMYQRLRRNL